MAMQALTVRGIEALKPQTKRDEVFDALAPGLAFKIDAVEGSACLRTLRSPPLS